MLQTGQNLRLNDVFTGWKTGAGIFNALQEFDVPWVSENIALQLDLEYHGNISGDKYISPLVSKFIEGETITDAERDELAHVIVSMCGVNWNKQFATMEFVYNPIENYSMTEKMTDDKTVTEYGKTHTRTDNLTHGKTGTDTQTPNTTETRTDNLTHGKTGTDTQTPNTTETRTDNLTHGKTGTDTQTPNTTETRTDNLTHGKTGMDTQTPNTTETQTPNLTNVSENTVHGFNSSAGVPTGEQSQKSTGTQTIARTGTDKTEYNTQETDTGTQETTRTGTDKTEYNTQETDTGTQETTRTGTDKTEYNTQETDTGTQETTRTGTDKIEYNTQETDTGTQTDNDSGTDTNTRNYELTRAGNIGVTTSQQMIESERSLWIWNYFREVVFPDIDRVLTLQIY